jgi:sugar phosphate isomerase/epimerase
MVHAKDRDVAGNFVTAGQGVIDFPYFLGLLRAMRFSGDLVTHGLPAADALQVAGYLSDCLAR